MTDNQSGSDWAQAISLSKSTILEYEQCPNRFKRHVLLNEPMPTSQEMEIGTAFHKNAEDFFDLIDLKELSDFNDNKDDIFLYMRSKLPKLTMYDSLLDNFALMETERWLYYIQNFAVPFFKPVLKEKYLENLTLHLTGHVDRVDRWIDGKIVVVDYKTGLWKEYKKTDYRFELVLYALLINSTNALPQKAELICIYHPRDKHVMFEPIKAQTISAVHRRVLKVREGLAVGCYDKNISLLCDYCGYAKSCLAEEDLKV